MTTIEMDLKAMLDSRDPKIANKRDQLFDFLFLNNVDLRKTILELRKKTQDQGAEIIRLRAEICDLQLALSEAIRDYTQLTSSE